MKQLLKLYTCYLLLLLFISSCEKEANIDIPKQPRKLVVTSFISPQDSQLTVSVTLSTPLFETDPDNNAFDYVTDATVSMSDGITTQVFTYNASLQLYTLPASQLPIVAGKTYHLKIATPDGKYAEAHCIVPVPGNQTPVLSALDSAELRSGATEYRFKINYTDQPGITNFYRLGAQVKTVNGQNFSAVAGNDPTNILQGSVLDDDTKQSGAEIIHRFTHEFYDYLSSPDSLHIDLLITDEPYYRFHSTLLSHLQAKNNPFAEPVLIYTNINGGLGCFAAYINKTSAIDIP